MTQSGWDFDKSGGSKKAEFTKFPQGVTNIRIIDEEPYVRWGHFIQRIKRSINCPGKNCPICEIRRQQKANKQPYTYEGGRRLVMNILNRETGKQEIMEQGVGFFQDLRDVMQELGEKGKKLSDVDIRIRRRGEGKDSSYRIDIGDEYPLTDKDKEAAKDKVDLTEFFKPHDPDKILRIIQGEEWDVVMNGEEKPAAEEEEVFALA